MQRSQGLAWMRNGRCDTVNCMQGLKPAIFAIVCGRTEVVP